MLGQPTTTTTGFKEQHEFTIRRKYLARRRSRAKTTGPSELDSHKCDTASEEDELRGGMTSTSTTDDEELLLVGGGGGGRHRSASQGSSSSCELANGGCSANVVGVTTVATGPQTQSMRLRLAFGVIVRLFLPLINGIGRRWQVLRSLKLRSYHANRSLFTSLFAHAANTVSMSLSSVQVVHRIDPWLKKITFRKSPTSVSSSDREPHHPHHLAKVRHLPLLLEEAPEKSVSLDILYEPPKTMPIRADVIFLHGLHGSLVNTWKQGMWNSEGRRVKFERPPRPPVRPPKRPRHSRRLDAPHQFKRPRHWTTTTTSHNSNLLQPPPPSIENMLLKACLESQSWPCARDLTYYCDEPETTETIDELEYSFPTFRTMVPEELSGGHSWLTGEGGNGGGGGGGDCEGGKREKFVKTSDYSPCWPRDWLSKRFPDCRVIALNYTTDPYLWRPLWIKKRNRTTLAERSREMTDMLIENRVGVEHPIIWVGHSKGGIFIKQIIVDAWESGRPAAEPLWRSSRGTFFYSVPHRGSPLADFNLPLLRQSVELLEIKKNCPSILDLHRRFVALYHKGHLKIKVYSFVETALTLMSVLYLRIVGVDSADPGIGDVCGVHLDHREICKPRSEECLLYRELVKMIESVS